MSRAPHGGNETSAENAAGIAELAQALGAGSTKLCEALSLVYGEHDARRLLAREIDGRLQPLVADLKTSAHPTQPN
jgi:hypothetical protein